jgi:hypothetical protein
MFFVRKKDKQAQIMVADLQPIHLILKQKIKTKRRRITGCSLLPEGRMVLSCYNTDGVGLFQIGKDQTGSDTYDAVYIKENNSVAVLSGKDRNRCINIIDIESQQVMTTISMDTDIYGMAVRGRTIYYCTGGNGLKMLNLSDKSVSYIINSDMSDVDYVATSGDKLYFTNYYTHTVTCCDIHGTTQWEFRDERVLQYPYGITVSNDRNVHVAGYNSNNVVVISPDGERH